MLKKILFFVGLVLSFMVGSVIISVLVGFMGFESHDAAILVSMALGVPLGVVIAIVGREVWDAYISEY